MIKRYLLFAGENYYPQQAQSSFVGDFDSIEECTEAIEKFTNSEDYYAEKLVDWWSVLDTVNRDWIESETGDFLRDIRMSEKYQRIISGKPIYDDDEF